MSTRFGRGLLPALVLALPILGLSACAGWRPFTPSKWDRVVCADSLAAGEFLRLPPAAQEFRREQARIWSQSARDYADQDMTCRVQGAIIGRMMIENRNNPGWLELPPVLSDLRQAIRWNPADARLLHWLATLELAAGRPLAGREHLRAAWDLLADGVVPANPGLAATIAAQLAWSHRAEGAWDDARYWLEQGRALAPRGHEFQVLEGLILAGEGRTLAARQAALRLGTLEYPELVSDAGGALMFARRATAAASRWVEAMAYLHAGQAEAAWHALQPLHWNSLTLPFAAQYWQDAGLIAEAAHRPEAGRCYDMAIWYSPVFRSVLPRAYHPGPVVADEPRPGTFCIVDDTGAFLGGSRFAYACLAQLKYRADPRGPEAPARFARARAAVDVCVARGILPAHALLLRGLAEVSGGDAGIARDDIAAAGSRFTPATVASDAALGSAWHELALLETRQGDLDHARHSFDRALQLRPSDGATWYNSGLLRLQQGDASGAEADLRQAANLLADAGPALAVLQAIAVEQRAPGR